MSYQLRWENPNTCFLTLSGSCSFPGVLTGVREPGGVILDRIFSR